MTFRSVIRHLLCYNCYINFMKAFVNNIERHQSSSLLSCPLLFEISAHAPLIEMFAYIAVIVVTRGTRAGAPYSN